MRTKSICGLITAEFRAKIRTVDLFKPPPPPPSNTHTPTASAAVSSKAVILLFINSLFVVAPTVCGSFLLGPCFVIKYLVSISSFTIISLRKRELVTLL